MRRTICFTALLPLLLCSCLTRIVTVSPNAGNIGTYSTSVSVPKTHTVTTTTRVIAADDDISLCLDLQAVGAAFAQSATIQEFERLLNNASYMLSNLDLNRDGYIDYLRVLETVEGRAHVFVIQAVLAPNVYQDVATLVAEVTSVTSAYVQVIGAPYIYGPNFIVRPVFIAVPSIYAHLFRPAYQPWRSPWYWDHFPTYYKRPAPVFVSHYQAYVNTYMSNHNYCREVRYENSYHYADYDRVSRTIQRNDYEQRYPERSFTSRNGGSSASASTRAQITPSSSQRVQNARDVRERQDAETVTTTTSTKRSSSTRAVATDAAPTRTQTATSRETVTPRASVSTRTASDVKRETAADATSATRVAADTGSRATATSGNATATTRSSAATTRSSATTSRNSATGTATRESGATRTTVSSRVNNSGSSNTRIQTVSQSGETSTTKRVSNDAGTSSRASSGNGSTRR